MTPQYTTLPFQPPPVADIEGETRKGHFEWAMIVITRRAPPVAVDWRKPALRFSASCKWNSEGVAPRPPEGELLEDRNILGRVAGAALVANSISGRTAREHVD